MKLTRSLLALGLVVSLARPAAASGCCGDGPPQGPRSAVPLELRETPGGPIEVMALPRSVPPEAAVRARAALASVPGFFRVELDFGRGLVQLWRRDPAVSSVEVVRALSSLGIAATPTVLSRLRLSGIGRKGKLEPFETFLSSVPGVAAVETEVEGDEGLARLWHSPAIAPGTIEAVAARIGARVVR